MEVILTYIVGFVALFFLVVLLMAGVAGVFKP